MKILHINGNYPYTSLHRIMIEKMPNDVDSTTFVPLHNDSKVHFEDSWNNVIASPCFDKVDRFFFTAKQKKIYQAVSSRVDFRSFDIVHAYTLFSDGNCARNIYISHGIPFVVAVRNTDVNDFFRFRINLRKTGFSVLKDAQRIFFLSNTYRDKVLDNYIPKSLKDEIQRKSIVIPNGIDNFWHENSTYKVTVPDKSCVNIVFVGRVDKNKNILTVLRAMPLLKKKGVSCKVTVVGRVSDQSIFRKIVKNDDVLYYPQMAKEQLINMYRSSDILVVPSRKESFGLVYAEAMSQGVPVIYTKNQGFDTQFEEGKIGYHVSPNSPREICDAVISILDNYLKISYEAYISSKKFDWEKIDMFYHEIYTQILKENATVR